MLKAISYFIAYTRENGSQHGITLHDLFLLQDFAIGDLVYCKNKHGKIIAILDRMNQDSEDVKLIRKSLHL